MIDASWIAQAITLIMNGVVDKLTKDNITAYRVKNIVRIDINTTEKK